MPIELQIKMWEVLTTYRDVLLDDQSAEGWERYCKFEASLDVNGFAEWEKRMAPLWVDDMEELEEMQS